MLQLLYTKAAYYDNNINNQKACQILMIIGTSNGEKLGSIPTI
jgi:hypothetical protein